MAVVARVRFEDRFGKLKRRFRGFREECPDWKNGVPALTGREWQRPRRTVRPEGVAKVSFKAPKAQGSHSLTVTHRGNAPVKGVAVSKVVKVT